MNIPFPLSFLVVPPCTILTDPEMSCRQWPPFSPSLTTNLVKSPLLTLFFAWFQPPGGHANSPPRLEPFPHFPMPRTPFAAPLKCGRQEKFVHGPSLMPVFSFLGSGLWAASIYFSSFRLPSRSLASWYDTPPYYFTLRSIPPCFFSRPFPQSPPPRSLLFCTTTPPFLSGPQATPKV